MQHAQQPIVEVEHLSKVFSVVSRDVSLRHEIGGIIRDFVVGRKHQSLHEPFYALRDISFSIQRGESVGIIGRNGAGKTTLLSILSRVMRPTSGRAVVNGTYASLLGLGAGFIETLSGRKNIYLNAAIYGINPEEIEAHIEDIIAFADIGRYIEMPIKDYSSGMRARLGFSIAIHTVPDIIFLDEILAVGDAAFSKKAGEQMEKILADQRTVILVSHSTNAILRSCKRCLWIHQGQLQMDDDAPAVVAEYSSFMQAQR